MGIVGDQPESGVRIDVERPLRQAAPWTYAGHAVTPDARFAVQAVVDGEGGVTVDVEPGAPAGLSERVRLLLRSAVKHAREDGADPPRRIVRWRADA